MRSAKSESRLAKLRRAAKFSRVAGGARPDVEARLESLEQRTLFSTIAWGGVTGAFEDPTKWVGGVVPGAGDTANINVAGNYTVSLTSAVTVQVLNLGTNTGSQTLSVNPGGALTVGGFASVSNNGTLNLSAASLSSSLLTNNGTILFGSGSTLNDNINNSGIFAVLSSGNTVNGTLNNTPTGNLNMSGSALTVNGTLNNTAGTITLTPSASGATSLSASNLINASGSNFNIASGGVGSVTITAPFSNNPSAFIAASAPTDFNLSGNSSFAGSLVVASQVNLNLAPGVTLTDTGTDMIGTAQQLLINGGTYSAPSANPITGASGTLVFGGGGQAAFATPYDTSRATLVVVQGATFASSSLTVSSNPLSLDGTLNVSNVSIGGTVTVLGSGGMSAISGSVATNSGAVINVKATVQGSAALNLGGGFINNGIIFLTADVSGSATLSTGSGVLTNNGTITADIGAGGSRVIDAPVDNFGALNISQPTSITGALTNEHGGVVDLEQASLFVQAGIDNKGDFTIDSELPGSSSSLNVNNQTFTNEFNGIFETGSGNSGLIGVLNAHLSNQGQVLLEEPIVINGPVDNQSSSFSIDGSVVIDLQGSNSLSNGGIINVSAGQALTVMNGTFTTNAANGGIFAASGSTLTFTSMVLSYSAGLEIPADTSLVLLDSTYGGGTLSPDIGGTITLGGSTINASVDLFGPLDVVGDPNGSVITGSLFTESGGGDITIHDGNGNGVASLTVPSGFDMMFGTLSLQAAIPGGARIGAGNGGTFTVESELDVRGNFGASADIDSDLDIEGSMSVGIDLAISGHLINGNSGGDGIDIEGSTATVAGGFLNAGTLSFDVMSATGAALFLESGGVTGTLVNTGTIISSAAFDAPLFIVAAVDNQGDININMQPLSIQMNGGTLDNSTGHLNIAGQLTVQVGSFITPDAGIVYSGSRTLVLAAANMTILDQLSQSTGTLEVLGNSTVSGGALNIGLMGTVLINNSEIDSDVDAFGTLSAGGTTTFDGALVTESSSNFSSIVTPGMSAHLFVPSQASFAGVVTLLNVGVAGTDVLEFGTSSGDASFINFGDFEVQRGSAPVMLDGTFINHGTAEFADDMTLGGLSNMSDGTVTIGANVSILVTVIDTALDQGTINLGGAGLSAPTLLILHSGGGPGLFDLDGGTLNVVAGTIGHTSFAGGLTNESGTFEVDAPAVIDLTTDSDLDGVLQFKADATVVLDADLFLDTNGEVFVIGSNVTFTGGGVLSTSAEGLFVVAGLQGTPAALTLPSFTNNGDIELDPDEANNGVVTLNVTGAFDNAGTLESTVTDPFVNITGGSNTGTIKIDGTLNLDLGGFSFSDTGTLDIEGGLLFITDGSYIHQTQSGAQFAGSGGAIEIDTGVFAQFSGSFNGTITNSGLLGTAAGLEVNAFTQSASGSLEDPIYFNTTLGVFVLDTVVVHGPAQLDGSVTIDVEDGYMPAAGDSFTLMQYTSHTGQFAQATLPAGMNGSTIPSLNYGVNAITLNQQAATPPTATLASASDIVNPNQTSYTFSVEYDGSNAIDTSTLGNGDVQVQFASGSPVLGTLVSFNAINPNQVIATYSVTPPNGETAFTMADNGGATISTNANHVFDVSGQTVHGGLIGMFNVNILEAGVDLVFASALTGGTVSAGSSFGVTVSVENRGDTDSAGYNILFHLSTDGTINNADDIFLASIPVSGVFAGSTLTYSLFVNIPAGLAGNYFIITQIDPNGVLNEIDTGNNFASTPGATLTITSPDLADGGTTVDFGTFHGGDIFRVTNVVTNLGSTAVPATTTVVHFSLDTIFGNADDIFLGNIPINSILQGGSFTITDSLTIPSNIPAGTYHVLAQIDGTNAVAESDETNNLFISAQTTTIVELGVDLTFANVNFPSGNFTAGGQFAGSFDIQNIGDTPSGPYSFAIVLSADSVFGNGDDELFFQQDVPTSIPAGGSASFSFSPVVPNVAGSFYILGGVSPTSAADANTGNNQARSGSPDFIVNAADLSLSGNLPSGTFHQNDSLSNQLTYNNNSTVAAGAFQVTIDLSTDTIFGNSDDILLSTNFVGPGLGGGSFTPTLTIFVPSNVPAGNYFVVAKIDSADQVIESDETNNILASATPNFIVLPAPMADLSGSASAGTGTYAAGGSIVVSATISNFGNAAAGPFGATLHLSMDSIFGNADDIDLSDTTAAGAPAGASVTSQMALTIPVGTPAGTYRLLALVDTNNTIAESNETNNLFIGSANITVAAAADLSVTTVTYAATTYMPGGTIAASAKILNSSASSTAGFVTKFILSSDSILGNGDDVVLATVPTAVGLAGNSTIVLTPSLTIPAATLPGAYFLIVQTDANNAVAESNETNNLLISPGANITVQTTVIAPTARLSLAPAVSLVGQTFYDFTVMYTGDIAVNVTTFGNANIRVTGPNGFSQLATLLPGSAVTSGKTRTASYRITAPDGAFSATNNGTYTISLEANQIADTSGNFAAATTLGSFNTNTAAGTVDLVLNSVTYAPGAFTAGSTLAISSSIKNTGNLPSGHFVQEYHLSLDSIFGNSDDILLGTVNVNTVAAGATRTATDIVKIPLTAASTSYFIIGKADGANAIAEIDETNNVIASDSANISVAAPDLTHPASGALPLTVLGGPGYTFTLRFAAQLTSDDLSAFRARVTGPKNFLQVATLQNVAFDTDQGTTTATYQITAPFAVWTSDQNGTYSIFFETNSAATTQTTAPSAPPSTFSSPAGSFQVAISNATRIRGEIAQGHDNDSYVDKAGKVHIAYFDPTDNVLKYVVRNVNGTFALIETIDGSASVDQSVKIVVDARGIPSVSYYDATNHVLKFAQRGATGGWTPVTLDSVGDVGQNPSMTLDRDGKVAISYYDATNKALKLAQQVKNNNFTTRILDNDGDVGQFSSIMVNPQDKRLFIAYTDATDNTINYADQDKQNRFKIDTIGPGVGAVSLSFGSDKQPAVSYYDPNKAYLKFAKFDGGAWHTIIASGTADVGQFNRLFFNTTTNKFNLFAYSNVNGVESVQEFDGGLTGFTSAALFNGGGKFLSVSQQIGVSSVVYGIVGSITAFDSLVFLTH